MIQYEWNAPMEDTVKEDIYRVIDYILERFKKPNMDVEVLVDCDDVIMMLNSSYRNVNSTTDVLSFPNYDGDIDDIDSGCLGSIAISYRKAQDQAKEYGHGFKREMCFLCTHGMLHLLGYDHMEPHEEHIMNALAEDILSKLQINRTDD